MKSLQLWEKMTFQNGIIPNIFLGDTYKIVEKHYFMYELFLFFCESFMLEFRCIGEIIILKTIFKTSVLSF
jgi:hypothetical protein